MSVPVLCSQCVSLCLLPSFITGAFLCLFQLLGLHSETGSVLWAAPVPGLSPRSASSVVLGLQRGTAHFPHPPAAVLLSGATLVTFNPITGGELHVHRLQYEAAQASLLPHTDNTHLKVGYVLTNDCHLVIHNTQSPGTFMLSTFFWPSFDLSIFHLPFLYPSSQRWEEE